jgi:hypothetical protein
MEKKWREENERIMREFPTMGDPVMLSGTTIEGQATTPALAGPANPDPDAEQAATYVAPDPVSPQDLANWHDPAPADSLAEPPSPPAESEPPQPDSPANPPVRADRSEEQLSLLPPDLPAAASGKAPK